GTSSTRLYRQVPQPTRPALAGGPCSTMMAGDALVKKLDLSKLTDEEAKQCLYSFHASAPPVLDTFHCVCEILLRELKTKIEKEDSKIELLGKQSNLSESHCIRCLQPFKFLVNSKRQCLDCQLFTCQACSRYNNKELGWVCDPCRMARVLKIGTLEWYHENVRQCQETKKREFNDYDTHSMPEVNDDSGEHRMEATDTQRSKEVQYLTLIHFLFGLYDCMRMRKKRGKRLVMVQPYDLDLDLDPDPDQDYSVHSGRSSCQKTSELLKNRPEQALL
ncbi:hypothetical protein CRUP_030477, partial [Coryphaenoides rupestris]